jgi:hypothetical protein
MDKTAIKNFSIWARNKLIADITYKAGLLGITKERIKDALPQSTKDAEFFDIGTKEPYAIRGKEIKQRRELVSVIQKKALQLEYKDAYRNVIEEVAYTWFDRLIAIRFMEVNDYMPAHIRVLSSESGKLEPDLVTTPFDAEIEFTQEEKENILQMKNDNQVDSLFRFLFIRQCNALNAYLPKLFEKISDYTELLLNVSVTDQDGVVYHLTHDIKEEDFNINNIGEDGKPTGQVEIIGWMYQYYNTEPKDETFALLKKNVKITKERIPAATQLFTPHWIVRYMVENSVGRLWLEGHEDEEQKNAKLREAWEYYLDEAEQEAEVKEQLKAIREEYKNIKPEDIKIIDPCMGSGHILVYAFDVLMQIYESYGYSQRDAAKSIVENNIYGLDIDDRAFQLAYFAIMMKARSYNRRFLTLGIEPNLYAIQESNGIEYDKEMGDFLLSEEHRETLQYLLHTFVDAKEYGSILNVEERDYDGFLRAWELTAEATLENLVMIGWYMECNQIVPVLAKQAKILSQKYDVVVTNPPYMIISNGNIKLNKYVKSVFQKGRADMFAVYIEQCCHFSNDLGYISIVTPQSWMFLTAFDKLRLMILDNVTLINLLQLGTGAFECGFGTTAFTIWKSNIDKYIGTFKNLSEGRGESGKQQCFFACKDDFMASNDRFRVLPNNVIAYWCSDSFQYIYATLPQLKEQFNLECGIKNGNNEMFLRAWFEVRLDKINNSDNRDECLKNLNHGKRWFKCNKGGGYKKWYGNYEYVVDLENDAQRIKQKVSASTYRLRRKDNYFWNTITWPLSGGNKFSCRFMDIDVLPDVNANIIILGGSREYCLMGYMNSKVFDTILNMLNPTLNFPIDTIGSAPYKDLQENEMVERIVKENIAICRAAWDEQEISWDFKCNSLIFTKGSTLLEDVYNKWKEKYLTQYYTLKKNEEKLNQFFGNYYSLENEIDFTVHEEDITIPKPNLREDIHRLLSYIVGCIFGRYSLNEYGIINTGGSIDVDKYKTFFPNTDNIILITDEEYMEEDIIYRVCEWFKVVYGIENLENNLSFVANALNMKENLGSSREIIRKYFLSNFFKDHCANYAVIGAGKKPIYWLFDSGKQNGFKALIYMHRYNADTIGNLRVDYLHRMERIYESEVNRMQDIIDNSGNTREVISASKRKEKLQKQLKECQEYDEKIGQLAISRIEIDLDDGVKVNYEKVQTARDGKFYEVLADSKAIMTKK